MNDEIKEALSEVLDTILKDKKLYDSVKKIKIGNKENITVHGIADMFINQEFNSPSNAYGISKMEAIQIQSYFSRYSSMNQFYINEMYKEFPGVFKGESKVSIDNINGLDKNIPLF